MTRSDVKVNSTTDSDDLVIGSVSVIFAKEQLKDSKIILSSVMILSFSKRSILFYKDVVSVKKGLNVFQKFLSFPTSLGSSWEKISLLLLCSI